VQIYEDHKRESALEAVVQNSASGLKKSKFQSRHLHQSARSQVTRAVQKPTRIDAARIGRRRKNARLFENHPAFLEEPRSNCVKCMFVFIQGDVMSPDVGVEASVEIEFGPRESQATK
jgi:hypothetical protein